MANIEIAKSSSENLVIPFTTQKPVARCLAVFQDGQIHYNPLVHSGDSLDLGVKIHADGVNYSPASQIYDPVIYDSSGDTWIKNGNPFVRERGVLNLYGQSYLDSQQTIHLEKSSYFHLSCDFRSFAPQGAAQTLFSVFVNSSSIVTLYKRAADNKLTLLVNDARLKQSTDVLNPSTLYSIELSYNNGVWDLKLNGTSLGTVSKNLNAGDYTIRIGVDINFAEYFCGEISNFSFTIGDTEKYLRFGD